MMADGGEILRTAIEYYSLEMLSRPVDLALLARQWGVTSIEKKSITSEAILLPGANGNKVILKEATTPGEMIRQRFSFAHELGHLLLKIIELSPSADTSLRNRSSISRDQEERICDRIAAEILMPRHAFVEDAERFEWELSNLRALARLYDVSIPATARRMVDLMEETCLLGVWKPATAGGTHSLEQSYGPDRRFGVRSSTGIANQRLGLIDRAATSRQVEAGNAPIVDRKRPRAVPADVPAQAWAWGSGEFRKVMVFYYPKRSQSTSSHFGKSNQK